MPRITAKRVDVCRFAAEVVTVFDTAHGSVVRQASVSATNVHRARHFTADALQDLHELPVDGENVLCFSTGCAIAAHFGGGKVSTDPTGLDQQNIVRVSSNMRHTGLGGKACIYGGATPDRTIRLRRVEVRDRLEARCLASEAAGATDASALAPTHDSGGSAGILAMRVAPG